MTSRSQHLRIAVLALMLPGVGVAQTASPQQKTPGRAVSSATNKPLSFFVGSWVNTESEINGWKIDSHTRIIVEPSERKEELHVTLTLRRDYTNPDTTHPESMWSRTDMSENGSLVRLGSDYKLIESPGNATCQTTNGLPAYKGTPEQESTSKCTPEAKTYTLKILSQDQIVLVYKPDGSKMKFERE